MSTIRIGIVGAGRITRDEHIPRFRRIDGVELVGVANRTSESSQRAAAELGIPRVFANWRELIADPAIDAVLVGAWPYLHGPVAIAALEAGKHVLTEARLATDGAMARDMVAASVRHPEAVAMVVPASFSFWADRAIRRLLDAGTIGMVRSVRVGWFAPFSPDPGEHWRWERRYSGNNVMALGILEESMARWLGHPLSVSAILQMIDPRKPGPGGFVTADVPDHVLALVEYPDRVHATIEMSGHTRFGGPQVVHLFGSAGTMRVDFSAERIEIATDASTGYEPADVRDGEPLEWSAEIDFVAAIRGERPVELTDFQTASRYMFFLDAVHASAREGRRVPVGE